MLSRVAENIFWMSRYMERTNFHLRNLQSQYLAYQNGKEVDNWAELFKEYKLYFSDGEINEINKFLEKVVFDSNIDSSIFNNVYRARENARSAQDHITKELWQGLNDFYHLVNNKEIQMELTCYDPISVFDLFIKQGMICYGVIDYSMAREEGFFFLKLGKYLERALQCIHFLRQQFVLTENTVHDDVSWRYLLVTLSGLEFYNRRNAGNIDPELIFNQIVYDEHFPNSITFSLNQVKEYSKNLEAGGISEVVEKINFVVGKTIAHVKYAKIDFNSDAKIDFLTETENKIYEIIQSINQNYFGLIY